MGEAISCEKFAQFRYLFERRGSLGDRPLGMAHTRQYIHGTTEDKYINPRSRSLTELIDFVR
jgi:hypothetical protein